APARSGRDRRRVALRDGAARPRPRRCAARARRRGPRRPVRPGRAVGRRRDPAVARGRVRAPRRGGGVMDPLIEVRDVTRRFGAFVAADRVSFDVPRGKIFGFLGPNGSGKSTTIRMLAGLLAPNAGRITGFGGLDVVKDTEQWKQRMGYMSQKFSL